MLLLYIKEKRNAIFYAGLNYRITLNSHVLLSEIVLYIIPVLVIFIFGKQYYIHGLLNTSGMIRITLKEDRG